MKVLIDMNLSPRWATVLTHGDWKPFTGHGWERAMPLTSKLWRTRGPTTMLCPRMIWNFAAILAATQGKKPSVVQIRAEQLNPDSIGKHVVAALQQLAVELDQGALVTVDPTRTRMRVLPLHTQDA